MTSEPDALGTRPAARARGHGTGHQNRMVEGAVHPAPVWGLGYDRPPGYALREPTMSLGLLCAWFGRQA
jgi:hypothetical protein